MLAAALLEVRAVMGGDPPCTDSPELFFPYGTNSEPLMLIVEEAKRICHDCRGQLVCLTGALQRREPMGVWGAQLFSRGAIVNPADLTAEQAASYTLQLLAESADANGEVTCSQEKLRARLSSRIQRRVLITQLRLALRALKKDGLISIARTADEHIFGVTDDGRTAATAASPRLPAPRRPKPAPTSSTAPLRHGTFGRVGGRDHPTQPSKTDASARRPKMRGKRRTATTVDRSAPVVLGQHPEAIPDDELPRYAHLATDTPGYERPDLPNSGYRLTQDRIAAVLEPLAAMGGVGRPSIPKIAARLGASPKSLYVLFAQLDAIGYLERSPVRGKPWRLTMFGVRWLADYDPDVLRRAPVAS